MYTLYITHNTLYTLYTLYNYILISYVKIEVFAVAACTHYRDTMLYIYIDVCRYIYARYYIIIRYVYTYPMYTHSIYHLLEYSY